jgi:hypothetical protein
MKQYIGIDPSFRKNGFAVCVIGGGEANFYIMDGFLEFVEWFKSWKAANESWKEFECELLFAVENSNMQNVTFDMRGSKQVIAKISRDAGKNQAISQCTVDYLEKKKYLSYLRLKKERKLKITRFLSLMRNRSESN